MGELSPDDLQNVVHWPFLPALARLGLAVAIGLFIGLEREHSGKAGVRTFALASLLGAAAGLSGGFYPAVSLAFTALIVAFVNARHLMMRTKLATTTSMALLLVAFCGVLCGEGHVFTPVATGLVTAGLLAWKQPISGFVGGLSDQEVRSAILLGIITFIIFPVLPSHPVDPWGLVEPQSNWASVIIIAAIGFINYILMKWLGPRGMEITAFFGGLINSRKIVVELTGRMQTVGSILSPSVYRGIMLATGAMVLRNGLIVLVLASQAASQCALPLTMMLLVSILLWSRYPLPSGSEAQGSLSLESPFQLSAALKFGLVFLSLNVVGGLAQRNFGSGSFYFVSIAGGLLSSASSIASAANLISHHEISVSTGVNGVVLSSLTSILINIPLMRSITKDAAFRRKVNFALVAIAVTGLAGVGLNALIFDWLPRFLSKD
jgi:uncharacterized membrane protein (DUF4010 family)